MAIAVELLPAAVTVRDGPAVVPPVQEAEVDGLLDTLSQATAPALLA